MAKKKTVISKVQEIINDTVKKEKEKDAKTKPRILAGDAICTTNFINLKSNE